MRVFGILAGLAAAGIWGGMYVVSKVVLDVIPPFTLLTLRLILGGAGLGAVILARGGFRATRQDWRRVFLVGVVGYGFSLGLQFTGTKLSTAATASLVTSASPVVILLFGAWLLQEPVTRRRLAALALASLGVLAVLDPSSASLGQRAFLGNLALLGAALTWGLYSVLVKQASGYLNTLEVSFIVLFGGLPIGVPLAWVELTTIGMGEITSGVVAGVLYLGIISTALAMYLWNKSLALLDAGLVSLLFFAQPVVGVALGALLLHEPLGLPFWSGAALISGGLLLAAATPGRVPSKQPTGTV